MSEEQLPLWRQALTDKTHPLNSAAWLLFSEKINVKYATKRLAEQKEAVIELIQSIFDDYEVLAMEDSLGKGLAPVNACKFIGAWRLKSYLPMLFDFMRDEDPETYIYSSASFALRDFGPEILPDVFAFQEANADVPDLAMSIVFVLSEVGKNDDRTFAYIYELFTQAKDEFAIEIMASALLDVDCEKASPIIEEWMQKNSHQMTARLKKVMPQLLQDARDGKF